MRRVLVVVGALALTFAIVAAVALARWPSARHVPFPVITNYLVDQDIGRDFPQNKQNEPSITRDPLTGVLVVGANDEIKNALCRDVTTPDANPCPFTPGASVSGYYRSTNDGKTWSGGMLPGFDAAGKVSDGDPSLDYGPRLCANGSFSFSCGVTIYYASLDESIGQGHGGGELTVSRSYDDSLTWVNPVETTSLGAAPDFADHEWLGVDHFPHSPHFGRIYLEWALFCGSSQCNGSVQVYTAHSDDEGRTWSLPLEVSQDADASSRTSRETGQMTVATSGTVEIFWSEYRGGPGAGSQQMVATSTDGGASFASPLAIDRVHEYPTHTPFTAVDHYNRIPGMTARVDCYPHPAADPRTPRTYVVWCDDANDHGTVQAATSLDGIHWTLLGAIASVPQHNAFFPAISVAPTGAVSLTFDALTAPEPAHRWDTGQQVYDVYYVQSPAGGQSFTTPVRVSTASSNPDGSSYNDLKAQFLGDYIGIVSTATTAYIVWTDTRHDASCPAVNAYRAALYTGGPAPAPPNPDRACPAAFGNTDIEMAAIPL